MLYIVATPIGNLKDITLRAIEILKSCDFVIAENPNYSKRLLQHIDNLFPNTIPEATSAEHEGYPESKNKIPAFAGMASKKELVQFAEHNEQQVVKNLTRRLQKETGCLITDAGTPGISDPGFRLVRECVKEKIDVVPIPGANAAITALCASGLPTDKFMFLGFLQKTASKTVSALQSASDAEATAIFYESPERIVKTLNYIANAFPTSQVVVARELTKMHEEFLRGSPLDVIHLLNEKSSIKGEITVLVSFKS
jgi:16S rRNA (cytidine1402-2'-O)-methyltransferase